MRKIIGTVLIVSLALLGSGSYVRANVEPDLAHSLFHLYVMIEKSGEHNPALYAVVDCVKNNRMENVDKQDVQDMVCWMVDLLQHHDAIAHESRSEPQEVSIDKNIETFLVDCIRSHADGYSISKQPKISCLSQLVVNSLEACEAQVLGDLTVDGQIINPCCQGTARPVGPQGPPGAPGSQGPQGPQGSCCITSDYLFATYLSMGFVGANGQIIDNSTSYFEVPAGQEGVIPLEITSSLTDGWTDSIGSNTAFVVPKSGLYKISYEIYLLLPDYAGRLAVAWVERNTGSANNQLFGSSVSFFSLYNLVQNLPTLRQTFLANLNANDEIALVLANRDAVPAIPIPLVVASGFESSVAASLVITRVE